MKKTYVAPRMDDYGTLTEIVLATCGGGSGDTGSIDGGADSAKVAVVVATLN